MTDITELALRLKLEAHRAVSNFNPQMNIKTRDLKELVEALENSESRLHEVAVACATAEQALEKAQQYAKERDEENQDLMLTIGRFRVEREGLEAIRAAAEKLVRCKGRYHSEQNYRALAALFGVKTPDLPPLEHENVHFADAAEMEIAALRQRIAELESRTVTVNLPLPRRKTADDYVDDTFEPCDLAAVYNACRLECEVKFKNALTAAGIKMEAE
ncbi:Ead domain protein [Klebsiella pneumoniae]|uniref:ead/Ea22-like family protein n=1 Tax=Klebsiella pneumoniae TaxID=573 RepID=UPI000E2B2064|nr:ead/Ea22-like family protein [Klebsiella pneumoniae]SWD47684.1 Ead domain protein [Klebsiella pneumoniae]